MKKTVNIRIATHSDFEQGRLYDQLEKFNMNLIERGSRYMVFEVCESLSKLTKILKTLRKLDIDEFQIKGVNRA